MDFGTWVCTTCGGIHREFNHKVKSPTMTTFKEEEIKFLQSKGNVVGQETWRPRWKSDDFGVPESGDVNKIREFIRLTYIDKKWCGAARSEAGSAKGSGGKTTTAQQRNSLPIVEKKTAPPPSLIDFDFFDTPSNGTETPQPVQQPFGQPSFASFGQPQQAFGQPPQAFGQPGFAQPSQPQANPFNPFAQTPSQPATQQPYNPFDIPSASAPQPQVNPFGQSAQVSRPPSSNPFDVAFDPLSSAPHSQPTVETVTNGMEDLGIFAPPPTAKPHGNDQFDFPSLKHPTQPSGSSSIAPLQPPPARSTLVKPSPIVNVMMNPSPSKAKIPQDDSPACPICGQTFSKDVSNMDINQHVDTCLNTGQIEGISTGNVGLASSSGTLGPRDRESKKVVKSLSASEPPKPSGGGNGEPWGQWFDLSKMEWYYGAIDRQEAEQILFKCLEDSFLVRKSSVKDSFALSLYNYKKQTVTHTLIEPRNGGYAFQDHQRVYATMVDLITKSPECGSLRPPPKTPVKLDY